MAGTPRCWEGDGQQAFKGGLPQTAQVADVGCGWAAVSRSQPGSLPGPVGPLPGKDLINSELLGKVLAPIAGHSSGERSPTGQIPACSSSKQSLLPEQSPPLWPM